MISIKLIHLQTPRGKRSIGPGQPAFIIAEMSCNHNQSYNRALKIIDAAAAAGADAIKLQTYTADIHTINSNKKFFQITSNKLWAGQTLYQLYQKIYTPWEWHPKLQRYAATKGLVFFSSPSDATSVKFLEQLNVPLYKIASYEMVDLSLLKVVAQ